MNPRLLLPATTALNTIAPQGRQMGILAGANVIMQIYPRSLLVKTMSFMTIKNTVVWKMQKPLKKSEMIWRRSVMRSKYLREILSKGERNMYNHYRRKQKSSFTMKKSWIL